MVAMEGKNIYHVENAENFLKNDKSVINVSV
jgi:hypothetical protein